METVLGVGIECDFGMIGLVGFGICWMVCIPCCVVLLESRSVYQRVLLLIQGRVYRVGTTLVLYALDGS